MKAGISFGILGLIGLLAVSVFFGAWYTVDQGERGVVLTNGAVSGVAGPGLGFKLPFVQSVVKISTQQQVISWSCVAGTECSRNQLPEMLAYSRDQQVAALRVTVNYHIPETEVKNVYSNYGSLEGLADRVIARKAPQEIKTIFGQFTAQSVVQDRAKFNAEINKRVAEVVDGPVIIDSVQTENIDFSDAYEKAIEDRMSAEVEVQKRQQQLAQEKINAEIAVTQAKGRADSTKAEADATAYQIERKGEAEANAIKARAIALNANASLIELTKAERWDGKLPTSMIPNGTVPFLDVHPSN